ncbi:GNAT family N-acetyltransferase [Thermanaerosceptrum fracticalcis]|uniref:GNAT family N-acetyltransferase n=2 Tax=Thermanaerosceptrum fracticalcis TaxID=1712410 RepID=A0A7G6DZ46_THEFR|nr:GNAT family N-acetyltransferase [Thermanaerosceptrum fracticalcis]
MWKYSNSENAPGEVGKMWYGRKIILRQLEEADATTLQKWYVDREFRLVYDDYASVALDSIQKEILNAKGDIKDPKTERVVYMVLRKQDQRPIGVAGLRHIDRKNGNAEIVLGIGEKDMRLAGYGVDILIFLLDLVFYELGFEKAYLRIYENNSLGLKSAISFGFIAEGKIRKQAFVEGKYVDLWILGLLREEYEGLPIVPKWKKK